MVHAVPGDLSQLGDFTWFLLLSKLTFSKISIRNTIRAYRTGLAFDRPGLGPNCLQMLSAEVKRGHL